MTNLSRRQWMSHGLAVAGALAAPQWALAQAKYPAKPVRVIVPSADVSVRSTRMPHTLPSSPRISVGAELKWM